MPRKRTSIGKIPDIRSDRYPRVSWQEKGHGHFTKARNDSWIEFGQERNFSESRISDSSQEKTLWSTDDLIRKATLKELSSHSLSLQWLRYIRHDNISEELICRKDKETRTARHFIIFTSEHSIKLHLWSSIKNSTRRTSWSTVMKKIHHLKTMHQEEI